MIVDRIENWKSYAWGPAWEKAFEFLTTVKADVPDGEIPIQGKDVFARILSYETQPGKHVQETHNDYIDIQVLLAGEERIGWYPRQDLKPSEPYNKEKDCELYSSKTPAPSYTDLRPGLFVAYLPNDAHMPGLMVHTPKKVRKVVIKLKVALLPHS